MFGDIYDYYLDQVGRYSWDGDDSTISVVVKWDVYNAGYSYYTHYFWFGVGVILDDVAVHEFTHAVTHYESDLAYAYESGAVDESIADIWGEWFDQDTSYNDVYGYDDNDEEDWLFAEDSSTGAHRNMKDPPALDYTPYPGFPWLWERPYPDRYEKPDDWYPGEGDFGGVHGNSSVGNKLGYLLTDGGTFNGFTITGLGIPAAINLIYRVQLDIVQNDKCFFKMYQTLIAGASTLGYSQAEILNLEKACQAVNIRNGSGVGFRIYNDGETPAMVALFEDTGKLKLKRTITENVLGSIDTSNGGFTVKDTTGNVVAYIDTKSSEVSDGAMWIKGSKSENVVPGESAGYLWVLRYEGVVVAAIDSSGNLKLWGRLYENVIF